MKTFSILSLPIALLAAWPYLSSPKPISIVSQGPTVERLERLAHLVATRVYIADVLVGEGEGCRGAWLIKGDALLGVDLRHAQIVDRDGAAKQATIRLPLPTVFQSRVDHNKTRTWEVRRTTWVPWNADADKLRDQVMREAQQLVDSTAGSSEYVGQAQQSAETCLRAFFEELDWQVKIVWDKPVAADQPHTRKP